MFTNSSVQMSACFAIIGSTASTTREFIPCISLDSVLQIEKKYYTQIYLEQCKYKVKERKIKSFIGYEVDSDSDSDE